MPAGHQSSSSSCLQMLSTGPVHIPTLSRTRLNGVWKDPKGLQRVWPLEDPTEVRLQLGDSGVTCCPTPGLGDGEQLGVPMGLRS